VIRIAGRTINVGVASGDARTRSPPRSTPRSARRSSSCRSRRPSRRTSSRARTSRRASTAATPSTRSSRARRRDGRDRAGRRRLGRRRRDRGARERRRPDYDAIALENHARADIALALAHVTPRGAPSEKKWRWVRPRRARLDRHGDDARPRRTIARSSVSTASSRRRCRARSPPPPASRCSREVAPERQLGRHALPLFPPYDAFDFTNSEVETALAAGITPLKPVVDPQTRVQHAGV
jgi:hypothetical protein